MKFDVSSEAARSARRSVGPTAWIVFEELVASAARDERGLCVRSNVRRLATDLSLNKDTAARALRRLTEAGLIERDDVSRNGDGRFASTGYRITATEVLPPTPATPRTPTKPNRRRTAAAVHQPALFPPAFS